MPMSPDTGPSAAEERFTPAQVQAILALPLFGDVEPRAPGTLWRGCRSSKGVVALGIHGAAFNALVRRGLAWSNSDGHFGLLPAGVKAKRDIIKS